MTFTPIEAVHPHLVHDISHEHYAGRVHKPRNPFSTVAGVNLQLIQLAHINPGILDLVKRNPAIIRLLNENPDLLQKLLEDPNLLQDFIVNPSSFLSKPEKVRELKQQVLNKSNEKTEGSAKDHLDTLVKSKERKNEVITKQSALLSNPSKEEVNLKPHNLESAIIAKAHVENPNTQRSIGEFRFINRVDARNSGVLPHDQELQPDLITTARAFALNPNLLKMMSAEAIALSRTKKLSATGNPDDDDYEIENESEEASSKEEIIEEVNRITEAESTNKITVGLK